MRERAVGARKALNELLGVEEAGKALETAVEAYSLRTQAVNDRIRNQNVPSAFAHLYLFFFFVKLTFTKLQKLNRTATEQLSALEESNRAVQAKLAELTVQRSDAHQGS